MVLPFVCLCRFEAALHSVLVLGCAATPIHHFALPGIKHRAAHARWQPV